MNTYRGWSVKMLLIVIALSCISTMLHGQIMTGPIMLGPDLVVTEFTVTQPGVKQGDFMKYNFKAKIKNQGNNNIGGPFYFSIQQKTQHMSTFNPTDNHYKVLHLDAGHVLTMEHTFSLNVENVSGKTVEVRGFVDSGGDREMPPPQRDVMEKNEDNNYSDVVTITGAYSPHIVSVKPFNAVNRVIVSLTQTQATDKIRIDGTGFGSTQGQHAVALFHIQNLHPPTLVNIHSWSSGVIYFIIPKDVETGRYVVAIVDKNTMTYQSNAVAVNVCYRKKMAWSSILGTWNDLKDSFSIRIHTWAGGPEYKNVSTMKMIGDPDTLDVKKIKLNKKNLGRYLYLVNDFKSKPGGMTLHKYTLDGVRLLANQMRLQIMFESAGLEVKGYFQRIGGKDYKDHGAPDLDINNAKLSITLGFLFKNGKLDYQLSVYFKADVDARDEAADWFMDLFLPEWDREIEQTMDEEIGKSLADAETKNNIINSFVGLVIGSTNVSKATLTNFEFTDQEVIATYYIIQ
jgi:hypothetical protein